MYFCKKIIKNMVATAISRAILSTDDDFFDFCQSIEMRDKRIERTKTGEIIIMEPTGGETGNFNFEIGAEVRDWNKANNAGRGFDSSTGFTLPNTAVKAADVSWVARERWEALPKALRKKFPPLTPDFIIEIRSDSDSLPKLKKKMEEFMDNGCRLGWLIDRTDECTYIYRADGSRETVNSFEETLSGEDVLVGFRLRIADLDWE
jgi:Uma2 family endonuclease